MIDFKALLAIVMAAVLVNNYVLAQFLGICPFLGVSKKLDSAVDRIREKFGADAILRASFLKQDQIDHMNGGISREKRNVDYSQLNINETGNS